MGEVGDPAKDWTGLDLFQNGTTNCTTETYFLSCTCFVCGVEGDVD